MLNVTPQKLLLSAMEAADALGISARTLWSLSVPRGDLPIVRIGSRIAYSPEDLKTFIESRRQVTPAA